MGKKKFKVPKKATTAIVSALLIIFNDNLGLNLSPEQIAGVVVVAVGYIYGQSQVDQKLIDNKLKHK